MQSILHWYSSLLVPINDNLLQNINWKPIVNITQACWWLNPQVCTHSKVYGSINSLNGHSKDDIYRIKFKPSHKSFVRLIRFNVITYPPAYQVSDSIAILSTTLRVVFLPSMSTQILNHYKILLSWYRSHPEIMWIVGEVMSQPFLFPTVSRLILRRGRLYSC